MSSKEKVLAIRPEAVCIDAMMGYRIIDNSVNIICPDKLTTFKRIEEEAWAAAYKYLTK